MTNSHRVVPPFTPDSETAQYVEEERPRMGTHTGHAMPGLDRNETHLAAHLYQIDNALSMDPGWPYCARGWNRSGGESYSIFRNNVGDRGVCAICQKRFREGKPPVPPTPRWTRWM